MDHELHAIECTCTGCTGNNLTETALESNQHGCSICQQEFESGRGLSVTGYPYNSYPDLLCRTCERKVVDENGEKFRGLGAKNGPYFVDGIKCWFRGASFMRDFWDCNSWGEFSAHNSNRFGW